MDNVMPELNPELLNKIIEDKAEEIFNLFLTAVNDQITDAVTQLKPEEVRAIAKACTKVHLTFFKSPLDNIPKEKLEGLNGAALEKLNMVADYWKGISVYIENLK
jgi:hypothetical protein